MGDQGGARPAGGTTFAEKLEELVVQAAAKRGGKRPSDRTIAEAITRAGVPVTGGYICLLRTGKRDNPTQRVVEALARYFGVPPAYFSGEAPADVVPPVGPEGDADVVHLFHRARGLSSEAIRAVLAMVEHARVVEGLAGEDGEHSPQG